MEKITINLWQRTALEEIKQIWTESDNTKNISDHKTDEDFINLAIFYFRRKLKDEMGK